MSRSGYSEDNAPWDLIKWRGQVASALRGKRGQAFLREMLVAMDAMPEKRLIAHDLVKDGEVCAIGSVAVARGIDISNLDPEDGEAIGSAFGIAHQLAQEIVYLNDECSGHHVVEVIVNGQSRRQWREDTPEERWQRMRQWVAEQLK
jgi:hypothetical protein